MKQRILAFLIIVFLIIIGAFLMNPHSESVQEVVVSDSVQEILHEVQEIDPVDELPAPLAEEEPETPDREEEVVQDTVALQARVKLDIPFIVQAPNADWDLPYKEACEEASLLMVHSYYQGTESLSQDEMKEAIDQIIFWGDETFGSFDTSAETSARYLTERLGYTQEQVTVIYDFTIDDIKALLSEGIPVIIPAAGRELGNEFFQDPGPLYHMLVITGYTDSTFITNDPGTRRGEDYEYDQEVLYNAIHDLTDDLEAISTGRKAMIIVQP